MRCRHGGQPRPAPHGAAQVPLYDCLIMAAGFPAPATAMAGVPGPAWGAPEVLDIVARILNERGSPALIVSPLVG